MSLNRLLERPISSMLRGSTPRSSDCGLRTVAGNRAVDSGSRLCRAVWALVALICLGPVLVPPGSVYASGDASTGRTGTAAELVRIVVILDRGNAVSDGVENRARAAAIARSLGVEPEAVYGSALFGFAAAVPRERIAEIAADPRVKGVEEDSVQRVPRPPATPR